MKQKTTHKATGLMAKKTLVNPIPKVIVVVSILLLLIGVSLYYQFASVGQATKPVPKGPVIETPITSAELNLDSLGAIHFNPLLNVLTVKETLSSQKGAEEVSVQVKQLSSGLLQYDVFYKNKDVAVAKGYLNDKVQSSGELYLDGDTVGDMELVYIGGDRKSVV